jgi:uncharacterized damage-inducible protein DinB
MFDPRVFFAYHRWGWGKVWDAARKLTPEQLKQPGVIAGGAGSGSLWETLSHSYAADRNWLRRWSAAEPTDVDTSGQSDLDGLWNRWTHLWDQRDVYLKDNELKGDITFTGLDKIERTEPLIWTVMQVANHHSHHRSEVCVGLTSLGNSPGSTELMDYYRAGAPGAP